MTMMNCWLLRIILHLPIFIPLKYKVKMKNSWEIPNTDSVALILPGYSWINRNWSRIIYLKNQGIRNTKILQFNCFQHHFKQQVSFLFVNDSTFANFKSASLWPISIDKKSICLFFFLQLTSVFFVFLTRLFYFGQCKWGKSSPFKMWL